MLSKYCDSQTGKLLIDQYGIQIVNILMKIPFFNRFSKENLKSCLHGCEVQYYSQDEIIFLKDRVGVITHGSVRVRSHQKSILVPTTIGRYRKGRIIGHGKSDNNITVKSNTWFTSFDQGTEIIFFEQKMFDALWKMHNLRTDYILLTKSLINNQFFKNLSQQTVYHIIFDVL